MAIYNSLRLFLSVGQLSGLIPFSMYAEPMRFERNRFWEIITWFWFFVNFAVLAVILLLYRDMIGVSSKSALSQALLYIIIIMNYVHTMFALLENFFKRDRYIRMLNILLELNDKFEREFELRMNYAALKKTYRKGLLVWLFEMIALIVLNYVRFQQAGIEEITNFSVFFMPTYVFGSLSYIFATTSVAIIRYSMDVLAIYLEDITRAQVIFVQNKRQETSKWKQIKGEKPQLCMEKLYFIKRSYNRVWEISMTVSNLIYLTMPIGCVNEFLILVFNGYWLFLYLLNDQAVHILFYVFVSCWSVASLTNLIYVANSCTSAVDTVNSKRMSPFLGGMTFLMILLLWH